VKLSADRTNYYGRRALSSGSEKFRFDLLFEIPVPRPWPKGKERARYHEALEQAAFAETMGFDTVWLVEHHFLVEHSHCSSPDAFIGALSQRTNTLRLGFGVALMPGHVNHPIRVAERTATADVLSDGRVEVGTGRSSSPFQVQPFGTSMATTREEWDEAVRLLPRLWTEEDLSYRGRFWQWDEKITVVPRPIQEPHPPLWVAATQPATCALAGEKGLGLLLPAITDPDNLRLQIAAYREAAAAPIDPVAMFDNEECALFTVAFCHPDDDRARAIGGPAGVWYQNVIRRNYADDWKDVPLENVPDSYRYHAELRRTGRVAGGAWQEGRLHSADELIDSGAFAVGDPAAVIERVERYRESGGSRLICIMQLGEIRHEDLMQSIELFGRVVIPHFNADVAEATTQATRQDQVSAP
jgi:alkanesulfonate monooxygenase SsuD/methylene tetrahydromethanopterin reductase-like flavin-dependent oxidoreductase (luciferase family)